MRKYISIGFYVLLFITTVVVIFYNGIPYANYGFCAASLLVSVNMLTLLPRMEKMRNKIFTVAAAVLSFLNGYLVCFTLFVPQHLKLQLALKLVIFVLFSLVVYHIDSFDFSKKQNS